MKNHGLKVVLMMGLMVGCGVVDPMHDPVHVATADAKDCIGTPAECVAQLRTESALSEVRNSQDEVSTAIDHNYQAQTNEDFGSCAESKQWESQTLGTQAVCKADCGALPDVSCSGTSCSAMDRNCGAGQRGYVECNGVRTYCPICGCTEGQVRYRTTNVCCCNYDDPINPEPRSMVVEEICHNGTWVQNATYCDGPNCGGICPV